MAGVSEETGPLDSELDGLAGQAVWQEAFWSRARRGSRVVLDFFVGQGAIQAIGIVGGLLLTRRLSLDSYAQYGLATGFQAAVAILMDLGFASTIIPLVGQNTGDKELVGRYVRSAKHLRDRSFLIVAGPATLVFLAIMHRHHWDWRVQAALCASVLLALYSGGKVSYFSAPYLLDGRLREYYLPQVFTGAARLASFGLLILFRCLSPWAASGLTALTVTANGYLLERRSGRSLVWPKSASPETDREIVQYVMPAAPAVIFAAFQSQISLFLISIFGGTVDVAQVAALGRIGALFAVLMTFNAIVVEPYVARLSPDRLLRIYLGLVGLAVVAATPVVTLAFLKPGFFLWVLGPKYANLSGEIGWLILASCISYLGGLVWIMNRSRKWLFWSGSALEIGLLVAVQALFVILVGVHTVQQAVLFTLAASVCPLAAHTYVGIVGFWKGSRHENTVPARG